WKNKMQEMRAAYQAVQSAQAALNSAPADKRDAAQKEVDRLSAQQKAVEADMYRIAAEDTARELQEYLPKAQNETGKKFETTPSGLHWATIKDGTGASPKPTDRVAVRYTG